MVYKSTGSSIENYLIYIRLRSFGKLCILSVKTVSLPCIVKTHWNARIRNIFLCLSHGLTNSWDPSGHETWWKHSDQNVDFNKLPRCCAINQIIYKRCGSVILWVFVGWVRIYNCGKDGAIPKRQQRTMTVDHWCHIIRIELSEMIHLIGKIWEKEDYNILRISNILVSIQVERWITLHWAYGAVSIDRFHLILTVFLTSCC